MLAGKRVVVLDFGLAWYAKAVNTLTHNGTLLGTPAYMSPEQTKADGSFNSPATDIYSLGVILFECLTGQQPFRGSTTKVLHQIQHSPHPKLRSIRRSLPKDLDIIVSRCLQKDPLSRYTTAIDLRDDLQRFVRGRPIEARQIRAWESFFSWCKFYPARALLAASLLLIAGLFGAWLSGIQKQSVLRNRTEQLEKTRESLAKARHRLENEMHLSRLSRASKEISLGDHQRASTMLAEFSPGWRGWEWHVLNRLSNTPVVSVDQTDGQPPEARVVFTVFAPECRRLFSAWDTGVITERNLWETKELFGIGESRQSASIQSFGQSIGKSDKVSGFDGEITVMKLSSDERWLGWGTTNGQIVVWSLATRQRILDVTLAPAAEVRDMAFESESENLLVGGNVGSTKASDESSRETLLQMFDLQSGKKTLAATLEVCAKLSQLVFLDQTHFAMASQRVGFSSKALSSETVPNAAEEELGAIDVYRIVESKRTNQPSDASKADPPKNRDPQFSIEKSQRLDGNASFQSMVYHKATRQLAWINQLGTVTAYSLADKEVVCEFNCGSRSVRAFSFTKDGSGVLIPVADDEISRCALRSGKRSSSFRGCHRSIVGCFELEHDPQTGQVLAASCDDGSVWFWLTKQNAHGCRISESPNHAMDLDWDRTSSSLLASYIPVKQSVPSGERQVQSDAPKFMVRSVPCSPFGVSVGAIALKSQSPRFPASGSLTSGSLGSGGANFAFLESSTKLQWIDRFSNKVIGTLEVPGEPVAVEYLKEEHVAVAISESVSDALTSEGNPNFPPSIEVWDLSAKRNVGRVAMPIDGDCTYMRASPDTTKLAIATESGHIVVWEIDTNALELDTQKKDVAEWHDAGLIDSASETLSQPVVLESHTEAVTDLVWSRNSRQLASASLDGTCVIWSVENRDSPKLTCRLRASERPITAISVHPSGNRFATGGDDGVVRVWDVQTGIEAFSWQPGESKIRAVRFSPNGEFLAIGSESGQVDFLDLRIP